MRPRYKVLFNFGVTLALLGVLVAKLDWQDFVVTLQSVKKSFFLYSYLVFLAGRIVLALRLQALIRPTRLRMSWYRLFGIILRSQFFGLFLPSDLGIAAARWYLVTENRVGRRFFIFVTALERMMLTLGLLLCTIVPLVFVTDERLQALRSTLLPLLILLLVACLLIVTVFITPLFRWFVAVYRWLTARFRVNSLAHLLAFHEDVRIYQEHKAAFAEAVAWHTLFQLLIIVQLYLLFAAMSIDLLPADILWMSMLVLLVVMIPISLAGLGLREAAFAYLFTLYGLAANQGALLGAMMSAQAVITAAVGGIVNLRFTSKRFVNPAETTSKTCEDGS